MNTAQYFSKWLKHKDATQERVNNAENLCAAVNRLIEHMEAAGVHFPINPATSTIVSGQTFGGFRPQNCPQGAPNSAHKRGMAVDLYDPDGAIDTWLLKHEKELTQFGLWFEHPDHTVGWSHWGTRPPKSGNRFFHV
jgi:hypothetical protein